jgi:hypothetical protein
MMKVKKKYLKILQTMAWIAGAIAIGLAVYGVYISFK